MSSFFARLGEWLRALFGGLPSPPPFGSVRPRVLLIIHNPVIEAEGGRTLTQVMSWNDPDRLASDFIRDLKGASNDLMEPVIVERLEVDEWPVKKDTFRYDDTFVQLY